MYGNITMKHFAFYDCCILIKKEKKRRRNRRRRMRRRKRRRKTRSLKGENHKGDIEMRCPDKLLLKELS
jgi:hypothetical protein